jgi:hypothetical protein
MGIFDFLKKNQDVPIDGDIVAKQAGNAVLLYMSIRADHSRQFSTIPMRMFATFYCALYDFVTARRTSQKDVMWFTQACVSIFQAHPERGVKTPEDFALETIVPYMTPVVTLALMRTNGSVRDAWKPQSKQCMTEIVVFGPFINGAAAGTIKTCELCSAAGRGPSQMLKGIDVGARLAGLQMSAFDSSAWGEVENMYAKIACAAH